MPPRKIRNPKTGRLVLANGAIGKKILAAKRKSAKRRKKKKKSTTTRTRPISALKRRHALLAKKAGVRKRRLYDSDSDSDLDSDSDSDYDSDYDSDNYVSVSDLYL
jgi:hypothetical protein